MKNQSLFTTNVGAILSALFLAASLHTLSAADAAKIFASSGEAVTALGQAVSTTNRAVLAELFGSAGHELVNPDEVQGAAELTKFSEAFNATNRLVHESDTRMVLEVGLDAWPFPIPLVKVAGGWQFDAAAGREELINRRIGRNELDVLKVLRAGVEAQREYASKDRDGDEVLEFALRLVRGEGRQGSP